MQEQTNRVADCQAHLLQQAADFFLDRAIDPRTYHGLVTLCLCLHNSHNAGNALQQDQDGTDLAVNGAKKTDHAFS